MLCFEYSMPKRFAHYVPKEVDKEIMEYKSTEHQTTLGDKNYTVRHLTPVFQKSEEQAEYKKKIEKELYEIFRKYMS